MSSLKHHSHAWPAGVLQPTSPARSLAAALLASASAMLGRLAVELAGAPLSVRRPSEPQLEFHAEAGAPEGALYVDGRLVGWLPGVSRL